MAEALKRSTLACAAVQGLTEIYTNAAMSWTEEMAHVGWGNSLNILRFSLRLLWILVAAAITAIWIVIGFLALYTFLIADGNPANTYTGQADDKHGAWTFLAIFSAWSVLTIFAVIWPLIRWSHRRARPATPTTR